LLSLSRASREALERTPGWAECAFQRRENWRGLFRRRLTPNRPLTLTTLCGLDNSHLLPPTVREHRNEDLLLGDICRRVHPAGWTLDLAFALPHRRDPAKRWLDVGCVAAPGARPFPARLSRPRASDYRQRSAGTAAAARRRRAARPVRGQ
jgi:hypothetical protein